MLVLSSLNLRTHRRGNSAVRVSNVTHVVARVEIGGLSSIRPLPLLVQVLSLSARDVQAALELAAGVRVGDRELAREQASPRGGELGFGFGLLRFLMFFRRRRGR